MPPALQSRVLRKSFGAIEWKADQPGSFRARIATLNVVDKDGEVTVPGAFPEGKEVIVSAYGHTSWYGSLPIGKAVIGSDQKEAWVDGQLFIDTTSGADTYKVLKALGKAGEWSYGFEVLDSSSDTKDLEAFPGAWRILKSLDVFEASPVLLGAGVNTATESIKAARGSVAKTRAAAATLKASADPATLAAIAQVDLLADELDELVDTLMDDFGIPDPDEIAEGEPEEPKGASALDPTRAMGAIKALVTRAKQRASLRVKEGRVLSNANRERLATLAESLNGALADIAELLTATDPDAGKAAAHEELQRILLEAEQRQTEIIAGRL